MPLTVEQTRRIDRSKEILVPAAEKLLQDTDVQSLARQGFGESQLRNLIAIANETESPKVVVNFVKYQMGRYRSWAEGGDASLGGRLIHQLEDDHGVVKKALQKVRGEGKEQRELGEMEEQEARIQLVRHFLGFASRYFKYLNSQRGGR